MFFFLNICIPLELPVGDSYWYSYYSMSLFYKQSRLSLFQTFSHCTSLVLSASPLLWFLFLIQLTLACIFFCMDIKEINAGSCKWDLCYLRYRQYMHVITDLYHISYVFEFIRNQFCSPVLLLKILRMVQRILLL